jgi:hypothetical protein
MEVSRDKDRLCFVFWVHVRSAGLIAGHDLTVATKLALLSANLGDRTIQSAGTACLKAQDEQSAPNEAKVHAC